MTTGHHRASSAGAVAEAIATWIDDRYRLNGDAVQVNRRLVASLCDIAIPLVDGAGRRVTMLAGRAGHVLSRGASRAEQAGSAVVDEVADAGRAGARAVRAAASPTRGPAGAPDADGEADPDGFDDALFADEDLVEVEVVEVVDFGDLPTGFAEDDGFLGEGLDQDLPADLGADLGDPMGALVDAPDGMVDEAPPAFVADEAPDVVPDPVAVQDLAAALEDLDDDTVDDDDLLDDDTVTEDVAVVEDVAVAEPVVTPEVEERVTGDPAAERRAGRRTAGTRSRTEGRPPRRNATPPRSGRRESTPTGGRTTRG